MAKNPKSPISQIQPPTKLKKPSSRKRAIPATIPAIVNSIEPDPIPDKPVTSARPARQPRPVPIPIPAILLEPDHVPAEEPAISGPGARFVVSAAPAKPVTVTIPDLPESYGTQEIFLAARDPYWLLASWDLDDQQRRRYHAKSTSGSLTVRLRIGGADGPIHLEIHTLPDSKDWFIHAGLPGTSFVAELGYHEKNSGHWQRISISKPVTAPNDRVAPAAPPSAPAPEIHFPISLPVLDSEPIEEKEVRRDEIIFAIQKPAPEPRWNQPPEPPHFLDAQRYEGWMESPPRLAPSATPVWTSAQAKALDELISMEFRRIQEGSMEIEELLRRRVTAAVSETPSSLELLDLGPEEALRKLLGLAREEAPSSLESAPVVETKRGFWFRVNAELIIYGSTEPDARVSIGGRPIRLRNDGSFSYRFALPDGAYQLPVIAVSRDGMESRAADLQFSRATEFIGNVGAHPQDAALKTPSPANV